MARLMIAGAVVAFVATPALAAPGFGSSSWSASSENTAREVEKDGQSLVELMLSLYGVSFDKQQISSKAGKSTRDTSPKTAECEQAKKAEEEKLAEAKKQRASGPEPVYLAF